MSSHIFFLLLLRLPPVSTLTSPRFPYTTPFRSAGFVRPLSSVQEDDTSAVLITFLVSAPEDLSSFLPAPLADAGLCSVPDNAGSGAFNTLRGRLSMARNAAASASAARRARSRSSSSPCSKPGDTASPRRVLDGERADFPGLSDTASAGCAADSAGDRKSTRLNSSH